MSDHLPSPTWDCKGCEALRPWPCTDARQGLAEEYAGNPVALAVYMEIQLQAASPVLEHVPPAELYERFVAWPLALRVPLDAP